MAKVIPQAGLPGEGRLASMSKWATASVVIPLLTGLSFAASTVFAYIWGRAIGGHGYYGVRAAVPMAIVCLILGISVGFPLRRGVVRIRDAGRPRPGSRILFMVGALWVLALILQWIIFSYITMSL